MAEKLIESSYLIVFDNVSEGHNFTGQSKVSIDATINSISARGGTSFSSALAAVQARIVRSPDGSAFFVAFFTDGMDTSGLGSAYHSHSHLSKPSPNLLQQVRSTIQAAGPFPVCKLGCLWLGNLFCRIHLL